MAVFHILATARKNGALVGIAIQGIGGIPVSFKSREDADAEVKRLRNLANENGQWFAFGSGQSVHYVECEFEVLP